MSKVITVETLAATLHVISKWEQPERYRHRAAAIYAALPAAPPDQPDALRAALLAIIEAYTDGDWQSFGRLIEEAATALVQQSDALRGGDPPTPEFLNWIADRFVHVHGESENVDFVRRLRQEAERSATWKPLVLGPNEIHAGFPGPSPTTAAISEEEKQ